MYLDAFPLSYWEEMAEQTKLYARQQGAEDYTGRGRRWRPEICTASNMLRLVAAALLRGLTNCNDNKEFFRGIAHRSQSTEFRRTGAADFIGMSLYDYEQLLRYLHLVDNTNRPSVDSDQHDKCYLVRPTITHAQSAMKRWCKPGEDLAGDEGPLPSRHNWLRKRNPNKPNKYFIELLILCCSVSRYCYHFTVNEGKEKCVLRENRRPGQHKFVNKWYKQHEYNAEDERFAKEYGTSAGQMQYWARILRDSAPDDDYTFHLHVDKRWCHLTGMVVAKDVHNVTYTCSVKKMRGIMWCMTWRCKSRRTVPTVESIEVQRQLSPTSR